MRERILKAIKSCRQTLGRLNKETLTSFALILVGIVAFVVAEQYDRRHAKAENLARTGQLQSSLAKIKEHPEQWKKVERDFPSFLGELRNNTIVAAAFTPYGILVSNTRGDKYYIPDYRDNLTGIFLKEYASLGRTFPLTSFGVAEPREPSIFEKYMLFIMIAGIMLVFTLRNETAFRPSRDNSVKFDDVIGAKEAKMALQDMVNYLQDPTRYADLGASPAKGVLLTGPPGVGKTLLARALAGEAGANFIAMTGSDFTSKWVGEGVGKVRRAFERARNHAPCILFIDEIDGIGKRTQDGGHIESEFNRIINKVLAEMDGFKPNSGILVIGATNFPDALDEALTRPGRFDRIVNIELPGVEDRKELFQHYSQKIVIEEDLDFKQLARLSIGMSAAAISYAVNHAAVLAVRGEERVVQMGHLLEAVEVALAGEKSSRPSSVRDELYRVAVHEAGHAIVAAHFGLGAVEKVSIMPRGRALGITMVTPENDSSLHTQSMLQKRIIMLLAGRCAEEIMTGEVSSGAAHDLSEASKIAYEMVTAFGMGAKTRLFSLQPVQAIYRNGGDPAGYFTEANEILDSLYEKCTKTLFQLKPALVAVTDKLLEHETIVGDVVVSEVSAAEELYWKTTTAEPGQHMSPSKDCNDDFAGTRQDAGQLCQEVFAS